MFVCKIETRIMVLIIELIIDLSYKNVQGTLKGKTKFKITKFKKVFIKKRKSKDDNHLRFRLC